MLFEVIFLLRLIKRFLGSDEFIILLGLVIIPTASFLLILGSPESPLYTSISRIAWVHRRWFSIFFWAVAVMSAMIFITHKMIMRGPLSERSKKAFFTYLFLNICLVFAGCLIFPAKPDADNANFANYIHDYLTAGAWLFYVLGLIFYSIAIGGKNKFLGFFGSSLMIFTVFSGLFFLRRVIDPQSYVGASAISEVYIINVLLIYLVVMYVLESRIENSE
jgi:hypothetical protein